MSFSIPPPMLTMTLSVRIKFLVLVCSRVFSVRVTNREFCVTTTESKTQVMRGDEMIIYVITRGLNESSFLFFSRVVEEKSLLES